MIALIGLSVARIPFLTTMGIAAALAVAIAVLIALTLLPALLGFGGEKLRPKAPRRKQYERSGPFRTGSGHEQDHGAAALGADHHQVAGADHRRR